MTPLSHKRPTSLKQFLYGTTYYPEHWNAETRKQDVERMAAAHFNVVRMAEFAWDVIEPEQGQHNFTLFDETIAALGAQNIDTILCTPTAAPPRWLTEAHPDVLRVNADGVRMQHGSRQHACLSSPVFRAYSRKITQAMAQHYAQNPHVIGWQTDNEFNCHFSECHCEHCQTAFQQFLRTKFTQDGLADIDALNAAWGTAFWAQTYRSFDEIPTPKHAKPANANPAHLLDYYRFISWNTARFQNEQVTLLRASNPQWFVTHNGTFQHIDYRGPFTEDLDFLGYDVYPFFDRDPAHRPISQAFNLDHARAWSGNFVIPEQQSGPGGGGHYLHDNPEPGEIQRMAYTSLAHGADSLQFFRWRTCRFGAEEYWCGILDHDNVPRRRYTEIKELGEELQVIGPEILGTHVRVDIGIAAADVDVYDAHETLSMGLPSPYAVAEMTHGFYFKRGYAVGCIHPSDDLRDLKTYIIPHWALFKPEWLPNLQHYVEEGGMLVIGARTATKDWRNNVIAETPPGLLAKFAGVTVVEYGRQNALDKRPLLIRFPKAKLMTRHWYEHLDIYPGTATLARWSGRHLERKPAITVKKVGKGAVLYVGTYLTDTLLKALTPIIEEFNGLTPLFPNAPQDIHFIVRQNAEKELWFIINDSGQDVLIPIMPEGINLLTGKPVAKWAMLNKHGVLVVKKALSQP